MKVDILSSSKRTKASLEVPVSIFNCRYNETLLHEVVTSYQTNGRSGSVAQLSRAEVRGGGAKPWRQKGTGRARAGTIRSPIWRSGGVTFAASPRTYYRKINRKVYRQAIRIIFSELLRQGRLLILDQIQIEPKTKQLTQWMKQWDLTNVLVIKEERDDALDLASRNLANIQVTTVQKVNPVILLQYDKVCLTVGAVEQLKEWLE